MKITPTPGFTTDKSQTVSPRLLENHFYRPVESDGQPFEAAIEDRQGVDPVARSAAARARREQQDEEECETLEYLVLADHSRVHDAAGHNLSAHTQVQIDSPVLRATVPSRQVQRLAQGCRRTPYVVRTPVHDNSTAVNDPTNSLFTPPPSDRYHTQSEMDP